MTDESYSSQSSDPIPPGNKAPISLSIEVLPEYLVGFPMIVAVTCRNWTDRSSVYNLPDCDLWRTAGAVEFVFRAGDVRVVLPAAPGRRGEEPPYGFDLEPKEERRMLFDISGLNPPLGPGEYLLTGSYKLPAGMAIAPTLKVMLAAPDSVDAAIAHRLRSVNDRNEPSWANFIEHNWRTIYVNAPPPEQAEPARYLDAHKLSQPARQLLGFHLFLHRAIYGPEPVAQLNIKEVEAFAQGPLEGEGMLLRLEIMRARNDPTAQDIESDLLKKWPGLRWRVEEIEKGSGFLTTGRRLRGAEREFDQKPSFYPYIGK